MGGRGGTSTATGAGRPASEYSGALDEVNKGTIDYGQSGQVYVNTVLKTSDDWFMAFEGLDDVSPENISGLRAYTSGGDIRMSQLLKTGEGSKVTRGQLSKIDKAFEQVSGTDTNMVVLRGVIDSGLNKAFDSGNLKGTIIESPSFVSTTTSRYTASRFMNADKGILLEVRVPKGTKAIPLGVKGSKKPHEREILLNHGTKLRVVGQRTGTYSHQAAHDLPVRTYTQRILTVEVVK